MKVFISVVSHGHCELINKLACISSLIQGFQVIIKSNKLSDNFEELTNSSNFHWVNDQYGCGFGHNNNIIFNYCRANLDMKDEDYFLVLNPDVIIAVSDIKQLLENMDEDKAQLSAINLFKDKEKTIYDNSVRRFPSLKQFVSSFFGLGNDAIIDKNQLMSSSDIEWAAGSFLCFKAKHYMKLGGFDEGYFMYCEDIDICYRSLKEGKAVRYYPDIQALHLAQHANREIFSKHFYWHVSSVIRFLISRLGIISPKTSLIIK